MKLSTVLMGVGVGAFALVGCASDNANTPAEKLVGSWHKDCHLPSDAGHYRTVDVTFKNGIFSYKKIKYDDQGCTDNPQKFEEEGNYTVGNTTKGDDGKEAYELDITWGADHKSYHMFRFKDNGNLLLSGSRDGHNGSTKETRSDHFDANWTGFKKQ